MTAKGFRVPVEDLESGDTKTMIVQAGDYMLIPFAPCHLSGRVMHANGTVQLTLRNHRPQGPAEAVSSS